MRINFHKRSGGFEAKKAFIFELEAHDHRSLEEDDGGGKEKWKMDE